MVVLYKCTYNARLIYNVFVCYSYVVLVSRDNYHLKVPGWSLGEVPKEYARD